MKNLATIAMVLAILPHGLILADQFDGKYDFDEVFPHILVGGGWTTVVTVSHVGNDPDSGKGRMRVFDRLARRFNPFAPLPPWGLTVNGRLACDSPDCRQDPEMNKFDFQLGTHETITFELGSVSEWPWPGVLLIESISYHLKSSVRYEKRDSNGEIKESVGLIPETLTFFSQYRMHVTETDGIHTGIALAPADLHGDGESWTLNFQFGIELFNENGTLEGSTAREASQHYAGFVQELFPDIPIPFRGWIRIYTEDKHLVGAGLLQEHRKGGESELTALPILPD